MSFVSMQFAGFFAVALLVYWALPWHRGRMLWLLAASAFFYMSWNPWLITLIVLSASIDYISALALERTTSPRGRRALLVVSIVLNLGLLTYFKYVNFFLDNLNALGNWVGFTGERRVLEVVLPLGISFYTFETISYIVDVYRGRVRAERNPLHYALFILFFPHLIAGPIVRPGDFLPQIRRRKRLQWSRMEVALRLFLVGFFKKAVLGDHLASVADPVFAAPASYDSLACLIAAVAYTGQIYCDFSGYSDMAIGLAHAFGFKLHRNFDSPYLSADVSEFWKRWHISLSSWLRDYLYIPMGGSRGSPAATHRNLLATMLIGGLWHGASWTFIAWGALHGTALVLHRAFSEHTRRRWPNLRLPRPIAVCLTFATVCAAFVLFRSVNIGDAAALLGRAAAPLIGMPAAGTPLSTPVIVLAVMLLAAVLVEQCAGVHWKAFAVPASRLGPAARGVAVGLAVVLLALLVAEDGKSFIYFQF